MRPGDGGPPRPGLVERRRLAPRLAVDVEHGVAAEHEGRSASEASGDRRGLALGQDQGHSWVGPVTSSSSTPLTITSGAKPGLREHARGAHGRGGGEDETAGHPTSVADRRRAVEPDRPAGSLPDMDRPPPDPSKLLVDWMEWEKGETPPGKVISNLKTHGLRDLLETLAAAQTADASV